MRRSSSGISPVVATVILVAIAIVIAIAVAFWASGLVGVFTRFEKIEIVSSYATPAGGGSYTVTVVAKNTGSSSATIDQIMINGVPAYNVTASGCEPISEASPPGISSLGEGEGACTITGSAALNPGASATITMTITPESPGITIEVAVHTASGKLYPSSVLLP